MYRIEFSAECGEWDVVEDGIESLDEARRIFAENGYDEDTGENSGYAIYDQNGNIYSASAE